ncbi:hypothetical protein [Nocardiopsis salina]|uniref:hypothetical protein n=1 Tax=Nocardiopsis salina TaxID=245836 RepID=UPI00034A2604|nr:hypothetical protein [Nocardiopsis salina]
MLLTHRDRFQDEEITVDMLCDLDRAGPGALLVADLRRPAFRISRARHLDQFSRGQLPIYGHGDLRHDLNCHDHDWEETADAVTDTTWDQLDYWTSYSRDMSPLVRTLRRDMGLRGMDLNRRPVLSFALDGTRLVKDSFTLRADPRITFVSHSGQHDPASLQASLDMFQHGQFVTGWTQLVTHEAPPEFVRQAAQQAELHRSAQP